MPCRWASAKFAFNAGARIAYFHRIGYRPSNAAKQEKNT
jgi:hypothetical protein